MKKAFALIIGLAVTIATYTTEIFYVKTDGNDVNDGKTWETAFADVQKAIDVAATATTDGNRIQVWIAKGT